MKCNVCHAPLSVRGYRKTGGRRVPLYRPCPRLDDPAAHPARHRGKARVDQLAIPASSAPFPVGARLRFRGRGPFASTVEAGIEVVVRSTAGTRSLFEHAGRSGAIWPEHADHWQDVTPKRAPLPPPFSVGTRVRYRGERRAYTTAEPGPDRRALIEPGMEVEITGTSPGRRGTGRPVGEPDEEGEQAIDRTRDGHSVYLVDDGTRLRGRIIWPADAGEWEVIGGQE